MRSTIRSSKSESSDDAVPKLTLALIVGNLQPNTIGVPTPV